MYWNQFRILKINEDEDVFYKIFCTFHQREWRLNSGIESFQEEGELVCFKGYSGSVHDCLLEGKDSTHPSWDRILEEILSNHLIRVIPYEQFKEEFNTKEGLC